MVYRILSIFINDVSAKKNENNFLIIFSGSRIPTAIASPITRCMILGAQRFPAAAIVTGKWLTG
jgi:hypothetical protein